MSRVQELTNRGLIKPPKFLPNNVHYETIMGSVAYGVSSDTSDMDIYGFCIPPKEDLFPHLKGEILGFGRQVQRFEQYQQHHIADKDSGKVYDITVYSIVKYFQLCMENNPNMLDSLFTPEDCVLSITELGRMVKDRRKDFLHKGSWHKLKGYAYSQLHKIEIKNPNGLKELEDFEKKNNLAPDVLGTKVTREQVLLEEFSRQQKDLGKASPLLLPNSLEVVTSALADLSDEQLAEYVGVWAIAGKRVDSVREYDFDVKFAYNVVRLLDEAEQILLYHDIDLRRNREQLKAIRRGDWTLQQIKEHFTKKEVQLDEVYAKSTLRHSPDEESIKQLLLDCLEHHYGSLQNAVVIPGALDKALADIVEIAERARGVMRV